MKKVMMRAEVNVFKPGDIIPANTDTTVNGPIDLDSQPERLMLRAMLYAWLSREDDPDDV